VQLFSYIQDTWKKILYDIKSCSVFLQVNMVNESQVNISENLLGLYNCTFVDEYLFFLKIFCRFEYACYSAYHNMQEREWKLLKFRSIIDGARSAKTCKIYTSQFVNCIHVRKMKIVFAKAPDFCFSF